MDDKRKNRRKQKINYEKPQIKKVFSEEHDRHRPFEALATSSNCGCG